MFVLFMSSTVPLLLLQTGDDPLQLAPFLPLYGLEDLRRALWLTAGGALPSQGLTVLKDEGVLVIPAGVERAVMSDESKHPANIRTLKDDCHHLIADQLNAEGLFPDFYPRKSPYIKVRNIQLYDNYNSKLRSKHELFTIK